MNHSTKITTIIGNAKKAREDLYKTILNLPKNSDKQMKKIGNNSYTANISMITKDKNMTLSPYYYIFEQQYKMIIKILKTTEIQNVISTLEDMIDKQSLRHANQTYKLNPKVIEHLKTVL